MLQRRIEEQSLSSIQKLHSKYRYFHDRLLAARETKAKCEKILNGKVDVNVDDPLGFLDRDELPEDFNNSM